MNIKDSYIHGADSRGVIKGLYFPETEEENLIDWSGATTNAEPGNYLIVTLADINQTKIAVPIPDLGVNISGAAAKIFTYAATDDKNYYLSFTDYNFSGSSPQQKRISVNQNIKYNPYNNLLTVINLATNTLSVSGTGGFNYEGIVTTSANVDRSVWFSSEDEDGTPCIAANFLYNASSSLLKVPKITISATAGFLYSGIQ
jgi:hypothetical protein